MLQYESPDPQLFHTSVTVLPHLVHTRATLCEIDVVRTVVVGSAEKTVSLTVVQCADIPSLAQRTVVEVHVFSQFDCVYLPISGLAVCFARGTWCGVSLKKINYTPSLNGERGEGREERSESEEEYN